MQAICRGLYVGYTYVEAYMQGICRGSYVGYMQRLICRVYVEAQMQGICRGSASNINSTQGASNIIIQPRFYSNSIELHTWANEYQRIMMDSLICPSCLTVCRKMFTINNFREFCKWSTFANIIISRTSLFAHTRCIRVHTIITTGDVTLRWRTPFAVVIAFPQVQCTSNERGSKRAKVLRNVSESPSRIFFYSTMQKHLLECSIMSSRVMQRCN